MSETPLQTPDPSSSDSRRRRLQRTEALLDRWLDLYELRLERAQKAFRESDDVPKLSELTRLTDLANVFNITRRACENELLFRRLDDSDQPAESPAFDPQLLIQSIRGEAPGG